VVQLKASFVTLLFPLLRCRAGRRIQQAGTERERGKNMFPRATARGEALNPLYRFQSYQALSDRRKDLTTVAKRSGWS
jgi:hypothetical protein